MIAEREVCREARRILRKLDGETRRLARGGNGKYLVWRGDKPESSHTTCAQPIVAAFLARDWVVALGTNPESYRLSEAGAAWLRRQEADGDPYAAQHQIRVKRTIVDEEGIERIVTANRGESPLERLRARGLIDAAQFAAGERLRRDYTLAQLGPRLGVDLSAHVMSGTRGAQREALIADTVLAAKQRFARAMEAVGPGLNDLLFEVCCALAGLEESERAFGWPTRAAKVVLGLALDRLALHYGFVVTAPNRAKMRGWRMD
ncbi:MAG TPA: DUF6456 domain-containing protein [Rhizomicrobium sp.]|nr:DUF6456 domain-containing protein [Rhizomicrobium sp.]